MVAVVVAGANEVEAARCRRLNEGISHKSNDLWGRLENYTMQCC